MASQRFVDNFWGVGYNEKEYEGFDILGKRLREGKYTVDHLSSYAKERAKIEEQYGKELQRLARATMFKYEIGTLRSSLDTLASETEQLGMDHLKLANRFNVDLKKSLEDFRLEQQVARKDIEEAVKKTQKMRNSALDKATKAKKAYDTKCKEADQLKGKCVPGLPPLEADKAEQKAAKAAQAAEQSNAAYMASVHSMEDARKQWEGDMEHCCTQFQKLEETRISWTRNLVWTMTNACSTACVDNDKHLEKIRKSLEACQIESDIDEFIDSHKTGSTRPPPLPYINYYGIGSDDMRGTPRTSGGTGRSSAMGAALSGAASAAAATGPVATKSVAPAPSVHVKAAYDYDAQCSEELSFVEGDIIKVLKRDDPEWLQGQTVTGNVGMVPVAFVVDL